MLPQAWLRQQWLGRALRNYPLYDPPHKAEEYLLSRAQAQENFDYFMRTRQERMAFLMVWLQRNFRVTITMDADGVRALNRWGNKYAGLLQLKDTEGNPTDSFFTYQPLWVDGNAGCNVLFDTGTLFGEIVIANLPKLHWALEPTAELLPRRWQKLKNSPGMSVQRPKLTGWDDPTGEGSMHHLLWMFSTTMLRRMTTFQGRARYNRMGWIDRAHVRDELINSFRTILDEPPAEADEFARMRSEMSSNEYVRLIDEVAEEDLGDERR
jgi:hypothetical protein